MPDVCLRIDGTTIDTGLTADDNVFQADLGAA